MASTGVVRAAAGEEDTASTTSPIPTSCTLPQPELPEEWLDREQLLEIKDEMDGPQPPSGTLLLQKAKNLVHHGLLADHILSKAHSLYKDKLSQAQATIIRLETDLAALPAFYTSQSQLEQERLRAENEQLQQQARILAKKLGGRRRRDSLVKSLDQGVDLEGKGPGQGGGDHFVEDGCDTATEIASEEEDNEEERIVALVEGNKTLSGEVHRLQEELRISNEATTRLESELRSLRAHIRQGIPSIGNTDLDPAPPSPPNSQEGRKPLAGGSSSHKAYLLLENAESELLLHAGRTVTKARRTDNNPQSLADEDAHGEPDHAAASSSDPAALPSSSTGLSRQATHEDVVALLQLAHGSSANDLTSTPSLGTSNGGELPSPRTSRRRRNSSAGGGWLGWAPPPPSAAAVVASGSLVGGGREAAQTAVYYSDAKASYAEGVAQEEEAGGGGTGTRSSTRRKRPRNSTLNEENSDDSDYYPSPPPASLSFNNGLSGAGPSPALRRASTSSSGGAGGRSGGGGRPLGQTLSALDVLAQASSSAAQAVGASSSGSSSRKKIKAELDEDYDGGDGRGGGGGSAGPPAKKARLPYTKWNVQEDEMLLKAVIQCGCAWDSVAKLCPTRAYHQVRQRFLRGLRSGETVPPELIHLQPAVLKSVADYEAKKRRKKAAKQQAEQLARAAVEDF